MFHEKEKAMKEVEAGKHGRGVCHQAMSSLEEKSPTYKRQIGVRPL